MSIDNANKVLAEACGAHLYHNEGESTSLKPLWADPAGHVVIWTIEDPRCREKVRNWWLNNRNNASVCFFNDAVEYEWINEFNESQACYMDNEIDCQIAIAEELGGWE